MGDRIFTIKCARLEDLATIPRSEKEPLLRVREGDIGYVNVQVEGHEYLVTRTHQFGVQVTRLDIEDLPLPARFFQAIKEFFTHQIADFFQLRGVGSRSYRIGKAVESWTGFADGQEKAEGPPSVLTPTVSFQTPGRRTTEGQSDYAVVHLANHGTRPAGKIKISTACKPLSERDCAWRNGLLCQLFGPATRLQAGKTPELDDAACRTELAAAFDLAGEDAQQAFARLYETMHVMVSAQGSALADAGSANVPLVTRAKLLLLGSAISTQVSAEQKPRKRSPQEAAEVLGMLGSSWHELSDHSEAAIQCWQVARRLSRCEFGLQMLLELIGRPADLPGPVVEQRQAALRIYLQSCDYLIARSDAARHECAAGASEIDALRAWTGHPIGAAEYAAGMLADANHPRQNRLAYRALLGAVKLLQIRALADPAWMKAQRQVMEAESSGPSLTAPLSKDEVVALALWRNGFRDDLDDGLLAQFQHLLNKLVMEWLPRRHVDLLTGVESELMPDDSPVALALGDPMTRAATRRTVTQQSQDYHTAMGRMARLLVLHFKMAAGAPLRQHEALLRDVLVFGDEIRKLGLPAEAAAEFELELEHILARLDSVARVMEIDKGAQSYSTDNLQKLHHHLHIHGDTKTCLAELRRHLAAMQARFAQTDLALESQHRFDGVAQDIATTQQIACLVRYGLLTQWLCSTEFGMRLHAYTVTDAFKNAVISNLIDFPANRPHRQEIEAELSGITRIDLDVIDEWAVEVGMLCATAPQGMPAGSEVSTGVPEMSRRFREYRQVVAMLRAGRDKADAGVVLPEAPRTREDFRRIASHRIDTNLGNGAKGSVSRTAGAAASVSIDAGAATILAGPAPTISVSFSQASTTTRTGSFGILSSSVGGQTMTVSETTGDTGQIGAGISVSTATALDVGVDASYVDRDGTEIGIAIRAPAIPGSRDWVKTSQNAVNVVFGKKLANKIEKDLAAVPYQSKGDRALRELCYQCFQPLLKGALALNVFDNKTSSESVNAGISAGVGVKVKEELLQGSVNARLGKETDLLTRQTRVDRTGSTRVAVHGIGTGSRCSAAVRVLATVLPREYTSHLKSGLSSGELVGTTVTFRERGAQHFIRRETRDGITQPSFAWDIVFRNVDDLIAHLNMPEVHEQWTAYNESQTPDVVKLELGKCMQYLRLHTRDSRQTFMVRRYLLDDKLTELNAWTALAEGLSGAIFPFGDLCSRYAVTQRCLSLLTKNEHYKLGGFGAYTGDFREEEIGLHGGLMLTETRTVSVSTELLWFNARISPRAPKSLEETDASVSKGHNPTLLVKPREKSIRASYSPELRNPPHSEVQAQVGSPIPSQELDHAPLLH
ncbi:hypothetical protein EM868_11890 [Cupriavidus gilardii]|uniref:hypothetical protein n=1 Tax=Cupriavidus gilardii TaxID=82541 RepID=UPI001EE62AB9|nr:hypothetical protein [Cupriavidus gilardii]MCG5260765.1 hypothetical protein [Cupriavidus gilardii]MDF9430493.1 hypothetical protein [Cupriavidus gilardii]